MRKIVLLLAVAFLLIGKAPAQEKKHKTAQESEAGQNASDARSFLELFTKLETAWMNAAQKKDRGALEAMLAPEFLVRSSMDPEHPISREDWIQNALTVGEVQSYSFHAMSIRAFIGVAVVSFVESQQATIEGRIGSGDQLIVDIWETNHGKWQPAVRFVAPVDK